MKLSALEKDAIKAIWTLTGITPDGWVYTNSITFAGGFSKLAGAMSSLYRKGIVEFQGQADNRGIAAKSKKQVRLTELGRQAVD